MAKAPDVGETRFTVEDAVTIQGELIEAQDKSYVLGLTLGLPEHEVAVIHREYQFPEERLLHVIIAFLKKVKPRPTWRVIVNALRSRAVNLPALARRVERAHIPDPVFTKLAASAKPQSLISHPGQEHQVGTAGDLTLPLSSCDEVKSVIADLQKRFEELKYGVIDCLKKQNILVKKVAAVLTLLSPDDDDRHKLFLEGHVEVLFKAATHDQLFGTMNFHWNYLDPSLLGNLVRVLELYEVKNVLDSYNLDLQQFRIKTPLTLYCQVQKGKRLRLTPEFRELVTEFDVPEHVQLMLEDVEQFRREYASHYGLHEFAMMLAQVRGSFIPTIPTAVAGSAIKTAASSNMGQSSNIAKSGLLKSYVVSQEYQFVKEPPEEFFCPITTELLLEPHLTSCCGNHFSKSAVDKIREDGKPCPNCREKEWKTMLNEELQHQVKSVRVYCHHEDRGCGWQGELRYLDHHLESCAFKNSPLISQLLKMTSDNKIEVSNVSITTKISFSYSGEQMEFIWKDAGINLYFPDANCEGENIKISVEVLGNIDEESLLPKGYRLMPSVSATYRVTASNDLPAPVRMRIEHCAILEKEDDIVFMAAHDGPPYSFKVLPNAIFPIEKSYGEIEVQTFSIIRLFKDFIRSFRSSSRSHSRSQIRLAIQLFYHDDSTVTFVATKNSPTHITAAKEHVQEIKKFTECDPIPMLCYSSTDEIVLGLPKESDGWNITSNPKPASLSTMSIKLYEPREIPEKVTLITEWKDSEDPVEKQVDISIEGGTVMKSFGLICRPPQPSNQPPVQEAQHEDKSVQYKAVIEQYSHIRSTLVSNGAAAHNLRAKYVTKEWLLPTARPDADELIDIALSQIKNDERNYEVFRGMLEDIAGLKDILNPVTTAS